MEDDIVARLRAELSEKDSALRQAAQYGQMITTRMKELEEAVKDRDRELEEAYSRLSDFESKTKDLEKQLSSNQVQSERSNQQSHFQEELYQLQSRYELLQDQLAEATSTNKQLTRSLSEKDASLLRFQQAEKAAAELREFANHSAEQVESLSSQLDESKKTILELRRYNETLKGTVEQMKQTKMAAIAEATEQQRTDEEKEKIEQLLKERLQKAESRIREQDEQIAEYRLQKRKLDDAVAAMARQTQVLYKERDELASRLNHATSKIGTLVRSASQIAQDEIEVSLMDDIEDTHDLDTLIPTEEDTTGDSLLDSLIDDQPQQQQFFEDQVIDNGLVDTEFTEQDSVLLVGVDDEQQQVPPTTTTTIIQDKEIPFDESNSTVVDPFTTIQEPVLVSPLTTTSTSTSTSPSSSSSRSKDRDNNDDGMGMMSGARCEEFFYLAATSIKIQMAIQNPQFSDGVFRINIKALHDQAIQSDVPFHEWYEWLKVALRKKQAALVSSVTAQPSDPINRVDVVTYNDHIERAPATPPKSVQTPPPQKRGWFGFW